MAPLSCYPNYIQFNEEEEKLLQDCLKHTNAGIKKTLILALRNYQSQLITVLATEENKDDLIEIRSLLHDLSSHLEENNCLIKRMLES